MQANREEEKRKEERMKQRSKKIIIITFAVVIGFIVLYYAVSAIASRLKPDKTPETNKESFIFYPADFDYDIMKDTAYLELDRSVYYKDPGSGMTSNSMDDVPSSYKDYAQLLTDYVTYAIAGNEGGINAMYSDKYYANGGKDKPEFTMQRLYDILITYWGASDDDEDVLVFTLEYKIRRNDGTFRNDMGSDCSKKEYFLLKEYEDEIKIDAVVVYSTAGSR